MAKDKSDANKWLTKTIKTKMGKDNKNPKKICTGRLGKFLHKWGRTYSDDDTANRRLCD